MDHKKVELSPAAFFRRWHEDRKSRVHKNCGGIVMPDGYCMKCQVEGVSDRSLRRLA